MGFCGILGCLRHEYYWIFTLVNDLVGKPSPFPARNPARNLRHWLQHISMAFPWLLRWPIEIDGLPFLKMGGFSMANC